MPRPHSMAGYLEHEIANATELAYAENERHHRRWHSNSYGEQFHIGSRLILPVNMMNTWMRDCGSPTTDNPKIKRHYEITPLPLPG